MATRANSGQGSGRRGEEPLDPPYLARLFHDMRGPLNIVIGMTDLLVREQVEPGSAQHAEFLRDILNAGQRLLQLIDGASRLVGKGSPSGRVE
jgi:K+-sensing histidine kinase KdpD